MNILSHTLVVSKLISRRKKIKLDLINNGYQILKNKGQLDFLVQLQDVLTKTKLNNVYFPKSLLESGFDVELSIRQYLKVRVLSLRFNKAFLYSIGSGKPFRHPLPKEWRQALVEQKIKVDDTSCALLWQLRVFMFWGYGILQGIKGIYHLFRTQPKLGKYVYFDNLGKNNLSNNIKDHNIVNWYLQWKGKAKNINSIAHSVAGVENYNHQILQIIHTDELPKIKGVKIIKYTLWLIYLTFESLLLIFFRPHYAFLLCEILKLLRLKIANNNHLANDYLFHNSGAFYRPLWTYEAERKGARILFYFYSTNNAVFKTKDGYPLQYPWYLLSWTHYLVWDKYQVDFIKKFDKNNATIDEVGVIWFSCHNEKLLAIPKTSISVFDVAPFEENFNNIFGLGFSYEYYVPKVVNQFLNDIQDVLENNNTMAHKVKRINPLTHQKYTDNIEKLKEKKGYSSIHPSIDATQLIQKTQATISMPFTSTAIIAKLEGKPSVYYDPSGMIQKDDRAAHGIPVLSNVGELKEWVDNLIMIK